ncbi:MAG: hypothetical protein LBU36_03305, partial [Clostridiales bacterium]|nr:hypothetical protein [Clostridiales bacterium]
MSKAANDLGLYIHYDGLNIDLLTARGSEIAKDLRGRAFVFTKNIDKRNNTTAYTAKAADINEFSDLSIGDRVTIP